MAIVKDLTINISRNKATLSKPVYLYLGDGQITLNLTINEVDTKIGTFTESTNLVENFGTVWAKVCVLKADGSLVYNQDRCKVDGKNLQFTIDKEFIDEIGDIGDKKESGELKLQIHLYDAEGDEANRFTIPPIAINILKPLCDIGHDSTP